MEKHTSFELDHISFKGYNKLLEIVSEVEMFCYNVYLELFVSCTSMFMLGFQLAGIQEALKSAGQTILTPLVSLDTPGKATVEVVIPADPVCRTCIILYQKFCCEIGINNKTM